MGETDWGALAGKTSTADGEALPVPCDLAVLHHLPPGSAALIDGHIFAEIGVENGLAGLPLAGR